MVGATSCNFTVKCASGGVILQPTNVGAVPAIAGSTGMYVTQPGVVYKVATAAGFIGTTSSALPMTVTAFCVGPSGAYVATLVASQPLPAPFLPLYLIQGGSQQFTAQTPFRAEPDPG